MDGIAVGCVRFDVGDEAAVTEMLDEAVADGIDAGLVVTAAVDVHDLLDEAEHGFSVRRQPIANLLFERFQAGFWARTRPRIDPAHAHISAFAPQLRPIKRNGSGQVQRRAHRAALAAGARDDYRRADEREIRNREPC